MTQIDALLSKIVQGGESSVEESEKAGYRISDEDEADGISKGRV